MLWIYAAVAAFALGTASGWALRDAKADRADADRMAEQQRQAARQAEKVDWSATEYERGRAAASARERVVVREVERLVATPEYQRQCLDTAGRQILEEDVDASNLRRALPPAASASGSAAPIDVRSDGELLPGRARLPSRD